MYKGQLFLGFLVESGAATMDLTDGPENQDSLYLSNVNFEGQSYLGKPVGSICDLASLMLLEKNIFSLHKQLLQSHSPPPALVLLTLEGPSHG